MKHAMYRRMRRRQRRQRVYCYWCGDQPVPTYLTEFCAKHGRSVWPKGFS